MARGMACRTVFALLVPWLLCSPNVAEAIEPDAAELLRAYEKNLDTYRRVAFHLEMKVTYEGFAQPRGTPIEESVHRLWRDGERWKILVSSTQWGGFSKGKLEKVTRTEERMFPRVGSIQVIMGSNAGPRQGLIAHLGELPEEEKRRVCTYRYAVVFGFLANNGLLLLPEILKQSKLSARKDQLDGRQLWVLEGVGKWGYHALWLDPERGYLVRRIEQRKQGGDWIEQEKALESLPKFKRTNFYPEAKLLERTLAVDEMRFDRVGGADVPTSFTHTETNRFDNGQSVAVKAHVRFSEIKTEP